MGFSLESLSDELVQKGIRPSYQRVKVLEYLHLKDVHPTVDEIYQHLSPEIPSLSKATIYNTLHTFAKAGLIRVVSIDETEIRYDVTLTDHGHFMCEACGAIFNFGIDIDKLPVTGLTQFQINWKNIYFTGICPNCISNQKEKKE